PVHLLPGIGKIQAEFFKRELLEQLEMAEKIPVRVLVKKPFLEKFLQFLVKGFGAFRFEPETELGQRVFRILFISENAAEVFQILAVKFGIFYAISKAGCRSGKEFLEEKKFRAAENAVAHETVRDLAAE